MLVYFSAWLSRLIYLLGAIDLSHHAFRHKAREMANKQQSVAAGDGFKLNIDLNSNPLAPDPGETELIPFTARGPGPTPRVAVAMLNTNTSSTSDHSAPPLRPSMQTENAKTPSGSALDQMHSSVSTTLGSSGLFWF